MLNIFIDMKFFFCLVRICIHKFVNITENDSQIDFFF